jgi:hypothetical protein
MATGLRSLRANSTTAMNAKGRPPHSVNAAAHMGPRPASDTYRKRDPEQPPHGGTTGNCQRGSDVHCAAGIGQSHSCQASGRMAIGKHKPVVTCPANLATLNQGNTYKLKLRASMHRKQLTATPSRRSRRGRGQAARARCLRWLKAHHRRRRWPVHAAVCGSMLKRYSTAAFDILARIGMARGTGAGCQAGM